MARKNRPVLYEVARRHPPHLKRQSPPAGRQAAPSPPAAAATPPQPPAEAQADSTASAKSVIADGPLRAAPLKAAARIEWSDRGPLVIGAAIVVVVVLVFAIRWMASGDSRTTPADSAGTAQPAMPAARDSSPAADASPTTPAPPDRHRSAETATARQAPTVELKRGYDYIFVQYFPKSKRRTAEKVGTFLQQHGIPCALYAGRRDVRLLATEAFRLNQPDRAAAAQARKRAEALLRRIRELGKQYRPEGYDLSGAAIKPIR